MTAPRKLLVLDLDETLFFACEHAFSRDEDFQIGDYYVYLRPHLQRFLAFCLETFDVAVWTSATASYAAQAVQAIFEDPSVLRFVWSRPRCTVRFDYETREHYWVKDLKKIRRLGHNLEQTLAVDDSANKHERNYGNLVRVRPFFGEQDDKELLLLIEYLKTLVDVPNVRAVEKRGWRAGYESIDVA